MGLSLGFAVIPEELPILIKVVLAAGAQKLASKGLVIKKLKTAESLGRITTILSDKTGTLSAVLRVNVHVQLQPVCVSDV